MYYNENPQMGPWMNMPGFNKMPNCNPNMSPVLNSANLYPVMYPEIYYRIYPIVCKVCDEMHELKTQMPTQQEAENMIDMAHDEVCRMYPDIREYANIYEANISSNSKNVTSEQIGPPMGYGGYYGEPWGGSPYGYANGRRGLLRDLVGVILIAELLRRARFGYI